MTTLKHESGLAALVIVAIATALLVGLAFAGPGTCW